MSNISDNGFNDIIVRARVSQEYYQSQVIHTPRYVKEMLRLRHDILHGHSPIKFVMDQLLSRDTIITPIYSRVMLIPALSNPAEQSLFPSRIDQPAGRGLLRSTRTTWGQMSLNLREIEGGLKERWIIVARIARYDSISDTSVIAGKSNIFINVRENN